MPRSRSSGGGSCAADSDCRNLFRKLITKLIMTHLEKGIEHFNAGGYFQAHEAIEIEWVRAERGERYFLQGIIHMAVAWHHAEAGNIPGAVRQVEKGLKKLAGYLPRHEGVETGTLCKQALGWRDAWVAGARAEGPAMIVFKQP